MDDHAHRPPLRHSTPTVTPTDYSAPAPLTSRSRSRSCIPRRRRPSYDADDLQALSQPQEWYLAAIDHAERAAYTSMSTPRLPLPTTSHAQRYTHPDFTSDGSTTYVSTTLPSEDDIPSPPTPPLPAPTPLGHTPMAWDTTPTAGFCYNVPQAVWDNITHHARLWKASRPQRPVH